MGNIIFKVYIKPISLNTWYSGKHWTFRKKYKDKCLETMKIDKDIDKEIEKLKAVNTPVKITTKAYIKSGKFFDVSNYFTMNKIIEDILVQLGGLKGDTMKYVSEHSVLSPERTKEETHIQVTIFI